MEGLIGLVLLIGGFILQSAREKDQARHAAQKANIARHPSLPTPAKPVTSLSPEPPAKAESAPAPTPVKEAATKAESAPAPEEAPIQEAPAQVTPAKEASPAQAETAPVVKPAAKKAAAPKVAPVMEASAAPAVAETVAKPATRATPRSRPAAKTPAPPEAAPAAVPASAPALAYPECAPFLLPPLPDKYDKVYLVKGRTEADPTLEINLARTTCTCETFLKSGSSHAAGDVRRLCGHIKAKMRQARVHEAMDELSWAVASADPIAPCHVRTTLYGVEAVVGFSPGESRVILFARPKPTGGYGRFIFDFASNQWQDGEAPVGVAEARKKLAELFPEQKG